MFGTRALAKCVEDLAGSVVHLANAVETNMRSIDRLITNHRQLDERVAMLENLLAVRPKDDGLAWVMGDTKASAEYEERQRMVAEQCDEGVHEFEERMVQEMGEMSLPVTVCRWCGVSKT